MFCLNTESHVDHSLHYVGNTETLDRERCIVGGDQLTRKRLQDCKFLRVLSNDPVKKFVHLEPIIIELWHMKQDLLEVRMLFLKADTKHFYDMVDFICVLNCTNPTFSCNI